MYFAFIFKLVETPGVCVLWGRGATPIFSYMYTYGLDNFLLLKILKFNIYLFFFCGGGGGGEGGGSEKMNSFGGMKKKLWIYFGRSLHYWTNWGGGYFHTF